MVFGKVMWVGRATVFLVGLSVILALVFGVATTALGANGDSFVLGKKNVAKAISTLVKKGPGPALKLQVGAGQPPLAVNSTARVANLNAATAGRADSAARADNATNAQNATNAGNANNAANLGGLAPSDYQRRVSGQCAAGSSIKTIGADGTVTCEADDGGGKAPDSELLDGKDSTQFANATHPHSGGDITSGTVEADRIEDGSGSNLNADQLDGKDSADFLGKTEKAADADKLDGQDSPALLNGQLIDTLQGNLSNAPNNSTGYIDVISNYTPPVNATAASFVRCSYDGNTAEQKLAIRAAMRSPSGSGNVTVGASFYLLTTTPGANMSVLNQNSDTFELTANQSYDFGVNTHNATPSNGFNPDYCTATVMIFRR